MSMVTHSTSANSSAASSLLDSYEDADTVKVKNYVKDMLKSRIFLGRYIERRLADKRIGYRDIVLISAAEVELTRDLTEAQFKLRTLYPSSHWIGITDTEVIGHHSPGVCLWTEIDNQPFGPFWFQIKSLKFRNDEIIVTLKCLRHISDAFLEIEPMLTGAVKRTKDATEQKTLETSVTALNETYTGIVDTLKTALSITNVKEFVTFLFAFIIAIFTGSTSFVNFIGNFILALLREFSILIKNSTPMFLGLLDFFSKIVGGFYILLAMLFRQSAPPPSSKRSVDHYDRSHRSDHHYDDRQFD